MESSDYLHSTILGTLESSAFTFIHLLDPSDMLPFKAHHRSPVLVLSGAFKEMTPGSDLLSGGIKHLPQIQLLFRWLRTLFSFYSQVILL